MKKLIAPFVLDVLVATAGIYVGVSQLLEGFSWLAVAIIATLAGANIIAAFKLGTNGRLKFSSTAAAGAVLLAWMIYVSIVSGVGALAVIGMVVGCAQIVIAVIAGKNGGLTVQRPRRIFRLSFHCLQHGVLHLGSVWAVSSNFVSADFRKMRTDNFQKSALRLCHREWTNNPA